jgi:hypothetical protein
LIRGGLSGEGFMHGYAWDLGAGALAEIRGTDGVNADRDLAGGFEILRKRRLSAGAFPGKNVRL